MEKQSVLGALAALAQETRLDIFRLLVEAGPPGMAAGALGEALELAPATLSFHLKELRHAGLVTARREGRSIIYTAGFHTIEGLIDYLTENCCRASGGACITRSAPGGRTVARNTITRAARTGGKRG
jgi:DNA-binding transcriptional ArsR family regulator